MNRDLVFATTFGIHPIRAYRIDSCMLRRLIKWRGWTDSVLTSFGLPSTISLTMGIYRVGYRLRAPWLPVPPTSGFLPTFVCFPSITRFDWRRILPFSIRSLTAASNLARVWGTHHTNFAVLGFRRRGVFR